MQEMRISQLVLDPTFESRQQEPQSCCGETQSSFFICLAVNTPLRTAIKSPTPVADKKLVASRRSTLRQKAEGKDVDTSVHSRVAERS